MKNIFSKSIIFVIILLFLNPTIYAQKNKKVFVATEFCELIVGIKNPIYFYGQQNQPISLYQIEAYLNTPYQYSENLPPIKIPIIEEYGKFIIRPDSLGFVEFKIKMEHGIETTKLQIKPIPAVCRLANQKANSEKKIKAAMLKAQPGIIASIECCGFDAYCRVTEFEVISIAPNHFSKKAFNKGARFDNKTLDLIREAQPGYIYIFRNIKYRCPGSEIQRSEDMIFEID